MVCRTVLLAAVSIIAAKPQITSSHIETQRTWENEKTIRPKPNSALAQAICPPRPSTVLREARRRAAANAPQAMDAVNRPNVSDLPWSTCVAKTGRSTVLSGVAARLTTVSRSRISRIGRKPRA